jgi:hypothetical protein
MIGRASATATQSRSSTAPIHPRRRRRSFDCPAQTPRTYRHTFNSISKRDAATPSTTRSASASIVYTRADRESRLIGDLKSP